jgi:uncharacterized repeat protein (TIGR02543 family)
MTVNTGELVTLNFKSKDGFQFKNWSVESGRLSNVDLASSTISFFMPNQNLSIRANYDSHYTINYHGNGGTGSTSNSSCTISDAYNGAAQGSSCSLSLRANGFSKTSYSFNGWSTSSSASSGSVAGTTVAISSDTTYYATWKQDVTLKTVCETYSSDDLFGTRKGAIDGNYGTWHSSLDYTYTCSTAVGKCSRSNGYERICVTDACGPYKGKTASWMKDNEPSCSKLSRLWCSCSDTGEF